MEKLRYRERLPLMASRLRLGRSALEVSPVCLGRVLDPRIVVDAYDMGVNFFFLTADLHWPLYEGSRRGIELLLESRPSAREEIVIAVASYLDQPLFAYLQLNEVLGSIRTLRRIDLVLAGTVPCPENLARRMPALARAKITRLGGTRAIGASYHSRPTALSAIDQDVLDIHFIRLNALHPGARTDLLPLIPTDRAALVFNFTSMMGTVPASRFAGLGLQAGSWCPKATDSYRYILSHAEIDGILCSPQSIAELEALHSCLGEPPLTPAELTYLERLATLSNPAYRSA